MLSNDAVSACVLKLGDEFELDLGACELRRKGKPQRLGRIPMDLLLLLVEHQGQLVTRDTIIARIWGKDVFLDTDNSINAAIRKIRQVLDDDPDQPRYVQTLIGRGYRFIAEIAAGGFDNGNASSRNPADSPVPGDLRADSGEQQERRSAVPGARPLRPAWRRAGALGIAAAVLALSLATALGGVRARLFHRSAPLPVSGFKTRPSVAVLGFKNLSGHEDKAWLSTALSEMLDAELASGQKLRLIAGENVERMKIDLALPAADTYAADTLQKIHRHLGSDMVVLGSYLALGNSAGGKLHISLELQDARSGETIAAVAEDGTEAGLPELVSRTGERVRQILQIGGLSLNDAEQVRAALPENPEAARLYAEGLLKLRGFDVLAARNLFEKAVALDPRHALSHAALSECWWSLGIDTKATEEGEKAMALAASLPREEQLSVEARYRWSAHQWPRAVEVYKTLWEVFPDNLDYGVNLARVQAQAGRGKESMATVEALGKNPLAAGDPRVDLAEASAADKLGDMRREERAAARAVEKGQQSGTRLLTGRALLTRGSALGALGEKDNAIATLTEAQAIFSEVGDQQGVARVLNNLGIIERHQAKFAEAEKHTTGALELFERTGSKQGALQAWNNLGNVYWEQGHIDKALHAQQQSLKIAEEMDDKQHESTSLSNIAGLLQLEGKLAEARRYYEQSLHLDQEAANKEGMGLVLGNLADLLTRQGDLSAARKLAEEALETDQQSGIKYLQGYALYQLAEVLAAQGETRAAESRFEDSARVRHEIHESVAEAESRLALAHLRFERMDLQGAEQTTRVIAETFHTGKSTDNEILSYSLLAMTLCKQGRISESQQALRKSRELSSKAVDPVVHLEADMENALVSGMSNSGIAGGTYKASELEQALKDLQSVGEKARHFGYVGIDLEARLHFGELELCAGKAGSARSHLQQLERQARALGFLTIARQAAVLAA